MQPLDLQQNATVTGLTANSQASQMILIDATSGGVARIETRLRSVGEQLSQIEEGMHNMHTVSVIRLHELL